MLDDEDMVIDDLPTPECIVSFVKIDYNINDEEDDEYNIGNGVEFGTKLVLPKCGSEPQRQWDLYLEQIDGEYDEKIPSSCFGIQRVDIEQTVDLEIIFLFPSLPTIIPHDSNHILEQAIRQTIHTLLILVGNVFIMKWDGFHIY